MRSGRFWLFFAGLLLLNIFITNVLFGPQQPKSVVLPYNVFKQQVAANNISSVTSTGNAITGNAKKPVRAGPGKVEHLESRCQQQLEWSRLNC